MARTQTWARNISRKVKKSGTRPIVNNEQIEALKRRAEDWGLILRNKSEKASKEGDKR